ncbi:MAG TPA: FKBP-type peptidyl-prolyl cis-trans isomerase [Candidatus Sulfotelmatobacter sp.]|nr:FKBP-type peptidyl-prolyl cis-trans isomerase [Candidatus Sulfotelmatobacter sp.]
MCQTKYRALTLSLAGTLLCGVAFAQQSSAPSTNPPASSGTSTTAPKSQTTTKSGATAAKKAPAPLALTTQKEKASYAIGMNIGKGLKDSLKRDDVDVSNEILLRGMRDALAGNKPLLSDEEAQQVLTTLQADLRKHKEELQAAAAAKNESAGSAFLAANKAKPGVVTLPSGLQYKVITQGNGPKPMPSDVVECNYKGTLIDGTEFDSSAKRGKPATFPVGQVIKGWTEALQLMPVGSKWELYLPPTLAYGERGTPNGPIGPNETLVFEVELLSIQPKPESKPAPAPGAMAPKAQPQTAPPPATKPQ